jgi:hypothetical protein
MNDINIIGLIMMIIGTVFLELICTALNFGGIVMVFVGFRFLSFGNYLLFK